MKTIAIRYVSRLLLFAFLVLMVSFFFSCASSKHRQMEKEKVKVEVSSDIKTETKTATEVDTKTENQTKEETKASETSILFEGQKGDTLTVIEENLTTGEKKKTTFIGSGRFQKGNKTSQEKKSGIQIETKQEKTETTNKKAIKQDVAFESSKKKVDVKKKTTFSWWWLLLLVIPLLYLNKRFNWFIRLKNHVTKLLKQ
jgi:hypothetical protein